MSNLTAAEVTWHDWIVEASEALGVDPALVDVTTIHGLTKRIAHDYDRPMAPVGAYLLGLAVGAHGGTPEHVSALRARLESTIHPLPD